MKKLMILALTLLICSYQLVAQVNRVNGRVIDETGSPVPGVNIIEKNTANGTISDANGGFSLNLLQSNAILVVSFVGYVSEEVQPSSSDLLITLTPDIVALQEIIVVAYGHQKKASVVGAISTASAEDLRQMGTPNLSNALAGRVAGLITIQSTGRPGGDDATIYIRGVATLNATNSQPLILVDGMERSFSQIDPEDIEGFSVLKDASATAVYGVRGANGVILITTKRGVKGKPVVSMSTQATLQQHTRIPDYLGSYDHAILRNKALSNDGLSPRFTQEDLDLYLSGESPYTHPDNDYIKDFLKPASFMQNMTLSVRGGTDRLKYFLSTNGLFQDGMYKQFDDAKYPSNAHFKRLNLRSNLDFNATKTTLVSLDLNSRGERQQNVRVGDVTTNSVFTEMNTTPPYYYPYRNPNGSFGSNSDGQATNLMALLNEWGYNRSNDNILEGTFKIRQDLDFMLKGLSTRGMVGFNSYFESMTKVGYQPAAYLYKPDGSYQLVTDETAPWISTEQGKGHRRRTNMEYAVDYSRRFGKSDVTGLLLYTQTQSIINQIVPVGFVGYVGRATYGYNQRYLAEFNFGYNGSDQFEKAHRFGFFPSYSLGWVASEESFLKQAAPFISFMKIRATYGEVGNDKIGTDRFLYLQTYYLRDNNNNLLYYYFGTDGSWGGQNALYEGTLGNDRVTWEVGKKKNFGLDLELFKSKFFLNIDIFREDREKIFASRNVSALLGVGLPNENIGRVRNEGFEIEAGLENKIGQLQYHLRGMVSLAKNTIVYQDEVPRRYEYMRRTGKPVGQNYGLIVLDYYTPDDFQKDTEGNLLRSADGKPILLESLPKPSWTKVQPGDFKYFDRNGDGLLDSYDEGPIGNSTIPQHIYSISHGFRYKGWDVNIMWQGAGGNHKFLTGAGAWEPVRERNRFLPFHLNHWSEERWLNGDKIEYPRLSSSENTHNHRLNTFYLNKGDYLRLKNVEVGYNVPKDFISKAGITRLRLYISGANLFTFSHIKTHDPEITERSGNVYPQMKLYNLGLNVQF
jgi:TonB-linked SusC/RagA family outer membrane protein